MGSSKNNNRSISDRSQTLLDRLHQALSLGTWREGKWQCTDIQTQRQVVRSVLGFLDFITKDERSNPVVKDAMSAAVKALVSILEHKNVTVLSLAVDAAVKLVSVLHDAILQSFVLDLVSPLSSLVSYHQPEVSILCAKALDLMLSKPTLLKNEKGVWDILKRTETVRHAISNMRSFCGGTMQIELFQSMASLLSTVLRRWPPSRFPVYSDAASMTMLSDFLAKPDSCGKVEVLKLLSSIALCGNGAAKLLENGESLLRSIVQCMESSQPLSVRIEGFSLARRLAINEERFSKTSRLCCEPLVQAIISGMRKQGMDLRKVSAEQISLIRKACRLALITRWKGEHHLLFWKHGISIVLFDLLEIDLPQKRLSLEEQISIQRQLLKFGNLHALRNYTWDILGWLAIHCEEGFHPEGRENKLCIDWLISFTCSNFFSATHKINVYSSDILRNTKQFPVRAFLMMIYSPCKYIASEARSVLSELHGPHGMDNLKTFMSSLKDIQSGNNFSRQDEITNVMALACYIGSPLFRSWVLEFSGLKVLVALVRRCLRNPANAESLTASDSPRKRTCCYVSSEGWEGKDLLLLYSLWGLAELIKHLKCIKNELEISSRRMKYNIPELVESLQDICVVMSGPGVRWFASYALSSLGLYGFPSTLGERVGKAISETGHADIRLVLKNGEHLNAHSVVLAIRCPSLLQHRNKTSHSSVRSSTETSWELQREIRLSGHVDRQALLKILDFLHSGYLQAGEEDIKLLKALAKSCNLQPLLQTLCRERPKWGTPFPNFDLSLARSSVGFQCSDVILETNEQQNWKCRFCTYSVPHFHTHKVVLASKCRYMWGLFYSGMQESLSQSIKLNLSWEAMDKLVAWFYTDELPNPASGCLWEYTSDEEKLQELRPYVELCWLFDYWVLEDIKKACLHMVVSHLESAPQLSIKMIKAAVYFDVNELVDVATNLAAPLYRQFHDSGELDDLNEDIVHKIRSASVQRSLGNLRVRITDCK